MFILTVKNNKTDEKRVIEGTSLTKAYTDNGLHLAEWTIIDIKYQ